RPAGGVTGAVLRNPTARFTGPAPDVPGPGRYRETQERPWGKFPLAIQGLIVYNTEYTMKYPPQAFVLRLRSRAMDACEPCQAGNRAALSGTTCAARVPVRSGCLRRVFHGASFCRERPGSGAFPGFFQFTD